jgi:predicted site-specific integrase-resolvase
MGSIPIVSVADLARELGIDVQGLRRLIREHGLMPDYQQGKRHWLSDEDVARIMMHPAVRRTAGSRGN